ncbi:MAG: AAA family ATPase [Nitratireductor sp.]|nr:AAA family ATPase [Nitratireductor sp.]
MTSSDNQTKPRKTLLVSRDGELIKMARGAIGSSGAHQIIIAEKSISEVGAEVRDGQFDALVIDMDATAVGDFEHLQKIKRMTGPSTAVIVISQNFSPAAARILIQLKVTDFLIKPLATSDFVRSINNVLKNSSDEAQVEPQFLSFMGASGGVGNTVLALEAAAILNRFGHRIGRSTCVVDLNFQLGSCAEYLDLEPRFDINEIENAPERLDRQLLDVMLARHKSGLSLIAAPNKPSDMRSFKPALVIRLLDLVSAYFDYVVIDLPRSWFPWTETVLMGSNRVFITADMTVPSIRHARRVIEAIAEKGGKQIQPKVIVNRMDNRKNVAGLNAGDVTAALEGQLAGTIPNNYMLVREAVDRGVQLGDIDPSNNVSAALSAILLSDSEEAAAQSDAKSSLLSFGRKLLGRKAA